MAEIWKRPGLVALEMGWRLAAALPVWLVVGLYWRTGAMRFQPELLSSVSILRPIEAVVALAEFVKLLGLGHGPFRVRWMVLVIPVWVVCCAVGRAQIMMRLGAGLKRRMVSLLLLSCWRVVSVTGVWVIWLIGCGWIGKEEVLDPAWINLEPNLVLAFGLVVIWTLVLFVGWCWVSWLQQLAPVMSMGRDKGPDASLREAWRCGELRSKLVEINLVMGIVKVALAVLALVFSACPLPFSSVETQTFLTWWWVGVGVLWVVGSDYFHVVRLAAYLRLWETYEIVPEGAASGADVAS